MTTQIRELYVEFQPDLTNPVAPVPLGVLVMNEADGFARDWILLGREPRKDRRPPEFKNVTDLGFGIASGWVDALVQDLAEAPSNEAALDRVCARWRWNLYATEPREAKLTSQETIQARALQLYERHTGTPFPKSLLPGMKPPRQQVKRTKRRLPVHYYREEVIQRAVSM